MRGQIWLGSIMAVILGMGGVWAQGKGDLAAIVNGEGIYVADLDMILRHRPLPNGGQLTETQKKQLQLEALPILIDDVLLQQFVRKNAPKIDQGEVNKYLGSLEASLKAQNKTLQDFARETGQDAVVMRATITTMLQWAAYVNEHIPDADVKRYYDAYRDFFDMVKVRASHIMYRMTPTTTPQEVASARARLAALRADILAGKIDFAEAARKYSHCPSAKNGGDLDYFPRKFVVDERFARAAFSLQVGQVSDVVQSDYGLHLIKVTDRKREREPVPFEKIKDEVKQFASEEMRQAILAQEKKTAKIDIKIQMTPPGKK